MYEWDEDGVRGQWTEGPSQSTNASILALTVAQLRQAGHAAPGDVGKSPVLINYRLAGELPRYDHCPAPLVIPVS